MVCGSAAFWIIHKLINDKGGLHNRVTAKIQLEPFNLREAEEMLRLKNQAITRYQVIQLYMVTGGVPFYLEAVESEKSPMHNMNRRHNFEPPAFLHCPEVDAYAIFSGLCESPNSSIPYISAFKVIIF